MLCKCHFCQNEFSADAWRAWCSLDCQRNDGARQCFLASQNQQPDISLLQENKRLQLENAELKRKLDDVNTPDLVEACGEELFGNKWPAMTPREAWKKSIRAALRLARERWGLPPLKELDQP